MCMHVSILWELRQDKVIGSYLLDSECKRLITSLNYHLQIHYTLIVDVDRAASGVNDDTIASPTREPEPSFETPRQNVNVSAGICRARPTFQTTQRCCSRDCNPLTSYWSIPGDIRGVIAACCCYYNHTCAAPHPAKLRDEKLSPASTRSTTGTRARGCFPLDGNLRQ